MSLPPIPKKNGLSELIRSFEIKGANARAIFGERPIFRLRPIDKLRLLSNSELSEP